MRTIKFRGIRLDNGEWVYGDLLQTNEGSVCIGVHGQYIDDGMHFNDFYDETPYIDEDTLGQFTGLLDKNKKEIYEGDILSTDLAIPRCEVVFRNGCFALRLNDGDEDFYDIISPIDKSVDNTKYHNVIGSIHNKPRTAKREIICLKPS